MAEEAEFVGEPISRKRGDTVPDVILVKDQATGLPLASPDTYEFKLTVNTLRNPSAGEPGLQVYSVVGAVIDIPTARVQFAWTDLLADQAPGTYFYDIQQKDPGGKIKTIAKNKYKFYQDITKTT